MLATASAWEAEREHDPALAAPVSAFVFSRVRARVLTRYRQEWRYALRMASSDRGKSEMSEGDAAGPGETESFALLTGALEQLSTQERWLLEEIFWRERTEACLAERLQISQPAVNKRKRVALEKLKALL